MKDPNHVTSEGLQMVADSMPETIGNRAPKALLSEYAVVVRRMEDELKRLRHGSQEESPPRPPESSTDSV